VFVVLIISVEFHRKRNPLSILGYMFYRRCIFIFLFFKTLRGKTAEPIIVKSEHKMHPNSVLRKNTSSLFSFVSVIELS